MIKNLIIFLFTSFLIINIPNIVLAEDLVEPLAGGTAMDSETVQETSELEGAEGEDEEGIKHTPRVMTNLNYRGLNIQPSFSIQEAITDNIFAKDFDDQEKEDYVTITTLGMKLDFEKWGHYLEVDGKAVNRSYNEYTEEESNERFHNLKAQIFKDKFLEFNVKTNYVDSFESRTDAIMPRHLLFLANPGPRQNHYVDQVLSGGASINYGRSLRLDADYSFREVEFDDLGNSFRDRQVNGIDVKMTSANGKHSDFVVEYHMQDFNYDSIRSLNTIITPSAFSLDNREHTFYMGFRWDEPKYKGTFRLGVTKKTFNDVDGFIAHYGKGVDAELDKDKADGFLEEINGVGEFTVYRKYGESHEVNFRVERYIDEPSLAPIPYAITLGSPSTEQRFITVDNVSIDYRLFLTKNTSLNIGASYNNIEFSDFYIPGEKYVREDRTDGIHAGVRYMIDWLTIALDYQYKSRESNISDAHAHEANLPDETFDYIENRTMFTLGVHL